MVKCVFHETNKFNPVFKEFLVVEVNLLDFVEAVQAHRTSEYTNQIIATEQILSEVFLLFE